MVFGHILRYSTFPNRDCQALLKDLTRYSSLEGLCSSRSVKEQAKGMKDRLVWKDGLPISEQMNLRAIYRARIVFEGAVERRVKG